MFFFQADSPSLSDDQVYKLMANVSARVCLSDILSMREAGKDLRYGHMGLSLYSYDPLNIKHCGGGK